MIRDYEQADYPLLVGWWEAQKFPPPPKEFLPITGYISNNAAAGFLYLTNSPLVWMEWVVADPKADKALRHSSVNEVIEHICKQAAKVGGKIVFTSTSLWPFIERLKKAGFKVGDANTSHLMRVI